MTLVKLIGLLAIYSTLYFIPIELEIEISTTRDFYFILNFVRYED